MQDAAHGLSDHVEAHVVLVWALAKPFDLRVDETGIDLPHDVIAEAQPLDGAGAKFSIMTSPSSAMSVKIWRPRALLRFT